MNISHPKIEEVIENKQVQILKLRYREAEDLNSITLVVEVEPHGSGYVARIDPYSVYRCGAPLSLSMEPGDSVESSVRAILNKLDMHLEYYAEEPKPLLTNP